MNDWRERQDTNVRQPRLQEGFKGAGLKIAGLSALIVLLNIVKGVMDLKAGKVRNFLWDVADAAMTLIGLGTYLSNGIGDPGAAAFLYRLVGWANGVMSVVRQGLAWLDMGWAWLVNGIVKGISLAFNGTVVGAASTIVMKIFGSAILNAGLGLAHALLLGAFDEYADLTYQSKISIDLWCADYGQDACAAPPPQV